MLGELASRLASALGGATELERRRLAVLGARLVHPRHRLEQGRYRADELALRLSSRLAARLAGEAARPISDIRGSASYRWEVTEVVVRRLLSKLLIAEVAA